LLLALGGRASAEDDTALQTADELRAFLAGNTLYGENSYDGVRDFKWSEYHCPAWRSVYLRGHDIFRGKWWLEGNEVCYTYPDLEPGVNYCFRVEPQDDGTFEMIGRGDPPGERSRVTVLGRATGDPFHIQKLVGGTCDDLSS
jgi:hypothetical protein